MPFGGIKMAEQSCEMYGYKPNAELHKIFTEYHKTHSDAVFDVYTPEIRKARKAREIATLDEAKSTRDSLQSKPVVVQAKAGQGGRLFGAVTTGDIAEAVKAAGGPSVDKRKIEIGQPIKSTGSYTVTIRLHAEVSANIAVNVVAA